MQEKKERLRNFPQPFSHTFFGYTTLLLGIAQADRFITLAVMVSTFGFFADNFLATEILPRRRSVLPRRSVPLLLYTFCL